MIRSISLRLLGLLLHDLPARRQADLVAHLLKGTPLTGGVDKELLLTALEILQHRFHLRIIHLVLEVGEPVEGVRIPQFTNQECDPGILDPLALDEVSLTAVGQHIVHFFFRDRTGIIFLLGRGGGMPGFTAGW